MILTSAAPVLVVAAHADDEALGCGGTIARLARAGRPVHVLLLADGETSRLESGAPASGAGLIAERNSAARQASEVLGCSSVEVLAFPDNRLDHETLLDIIKPIEAALARHRPETVFTHHVGDVNVDHSRVHQAVIAATRPQPGRSVKELLFFEVPSSTEWQPPGSASAFTPNYFVDISTTLATKLAALQKYEREMRPFPHPRSAKAVTALAHWRGASAGLEAAEAFMLGRRIVD